MDTSGILPRDHDALVLEGCVFLHTGSDIKIGSLFLFSSLSKNTEKGNPTGLSFNFIVLAILIDSTVFVPDCRSKRVAKNERWHIGTKAVRQN